MANGPTELLDAREAAAYLRINEQTVRRLAREKAIPAFKVGGIWRFRRDALTAWAESQQEEPFSTRVLVVDDDEVILQFAREALLASNYEVATAESGEAALRQVESFRPDIIFLDLMMPAMHGPEVLAVLREEGCEIPVVIITGYPDSQLMAEALHYSPFTLLAKPFTAEQVEAAVQAALGQPPMRRSG
jgi:excisionase family DNA binding protein